MRNLNINKRVLVALNYMGKTDVVDDDGNETGESKINYGAEIVFKAHISGARGSSQVEVFGVELNYDKTFVLTKQEYKKLRFTENTIFFVDKKPEYDKNGDPLYDYRVERIAESVNEVVIALRKVRS